VVAGIGKILTSFRRDPSEGLIMEVPSYKLPGLKPLWKKVWFRLREFIIVAWPILIIGSIILSLLDFFHLGAFINRALSPLVVHLLGLPEQVGITLIFGVMRKEMSVVMLAQALGTTDFASVMTSTQVVVFTVFVIFYVPCVATLAVLWKILRWKGTLASILLTLGIATLMGIIFRFALGWLN
jgi:ferrous iron transport protein B